MAEVQSPDRGRHDDISTDCPGPWLCSWIEFQVDARINQAFRELAHSKLSATEVQTPSASKAPEHAPEPDKLQSVRGIAENQATLLRVVDGISEEVSHLSSVSIKLSEELTSLGESSAHQGREVDVLARAVRRTESRLAVWRDEVRAEVRGNAMRERGGAEARQLDGTALRDTEQRLDNTEQSQQALAEHVETWTSAANKDLVALENRVVEGLRSDFREALRQERESRLVLDEQLWRADQRLTERYNALADRLDRLSEGSWPPIEPTTRALPSRGLAVSHPPPPEVTATQDHVLAGISERAAAALKRSAPERFATLEAEHHAVAQQQAALHWPPTGHQSGAAGLARHQHQRSSWGGFAAAITRGPLPIETLSALTEGARDAPSSASATPRSEGAAAERLSEGGSRGRPP